MRPDPLTLLIEGFSGFDLALMIMASLVAALVIRRWSQLTAAVLIAYGADVLIRFLSETFNAGDVPADVAVTLAVSRMDAHALAATLRPFFYFALVAALFALKKRYGAR